MSADLPQSPERRLFLNQMARYGVGAGLLASGLAALPASAARADEAAAPAASWQNWSGSQKASPANIFYPDSEDALAKAIRDTQGQVRAFGGGHSFCLLYTSPSPRD